MALISVIVPIYNSRKYLRQCIDSIIVQNYYDIEIILVDDGSNDGSEGMCDEYAAKDNRIKVIHKTNGGLVSARKAGFEASTGQWIGFVDSDDWIEPDMYAKLFSCAQMYDVDVAMCGRFEDSELNSKPVFHGIDEGVYKNSDLKEKVFPKMIVNETFFEWGIFPSYWDKLFKKEKLSDYVLSVDEEIVMGEDAAGVFPCILNASSIYVLKECLYHYRQTSNSMVKTIVDRETEQMRFKLLYDYTLKVFDKSKDLYDCSEQWKKYVLFLMTPRADVLYQDLGKLDYLFPFSKVKRGDKVVIYGAGLWGRRLYNYLERTHFCNVVAIVDKNYKKLRTRNFNMISIDDIVRVEYDSIVIPASYANTRRAIVSDLRRKYPNANIYEPDEDEIFAEHTLVAFGLL